MKKTDNNKLGLIGLILGIVSLTGVVFCFLVHFSVI